MGSELSISVNFFGRSLIETSFLFKISLAGLACLRGFSTLISVGLIDRARPSISFLFSFIITEKVSFDFSPMDPQKLALSNSRSTVFEHHNKSLYSALDVNILYGSRVSFVIRSSIITPM